MLLYSGHHLRRRAPGLERRLVAVVSVCTTCVDMNWRRKSSAIGCRKQEMRERLIVPSSATGGEGGKPTCVPRGCVAVLVGEEDDAAERVVVEVRALGQPCVRALLDMAEREFGYDQKGVLRIPCAADEFRRAVAADDRGHHQRRRCTSR
ncbi:hypothetical protein PR202_gb14378 [Eleusine coracana subsp. coracana]|uniref:Uncharacterized protein n=1 Tax=Eleusine coracana subsp. coracana TaxID=191504 RepID=A0AAV5EVB5_ELECO|nr:hypothetical protein QOZ80_4BG0334750 [Eleusine coracana subsp. coracana]GJN26449.1 hypothetical protein PR202_gb14378 [Eleusine coracana subsp. coracana]